MTTLQMLRHEQQRPLHAGGMELMLDGLDQVKRYAGHPIITPLYAPSVKQHVIGLTTDRYQIVAQATQDHPEYYQPVKASLDKRYLVHDLQEILVETVVGTQEMQWQERLAAADVAGLERAHAVLFYRLGMFCADNKTSDLFTQMLNDARTACDIPGDGFGLAEKTPEAVIRYCAQARALCLDQRLQAECGRDRLYNPAYDRAVDTMLYFHDSIETRADFLGTFAGAIEKEDGTAFVVTVNREKLASAPDYAGDILANEEPHVTPLLSGRYERLLYQLDDMAGTIATPHLRQIAQAMTTHGARAFYQTTHDAYAMGPACCTHRGHVHTRAEATAFYAQALMHATPPLPPANGILLDRYQPG